jgi:signal transduction histidine kinase
MESVGRLAGGVAHDFNNMLTPIMGYAESLKRSMSLDDSRHAKLNEIIRASERSRDLVRQLLAFARKQNLEMKPVGLNRLIAGFENMLRRTLHENIKLEIHPATSMGLIMADIGQIEQIILNLAVNAQDAMPEGGALFISTSVTELDDLYIMDHCEVTAGLYIAMEITDTGKGIDPGTRERIFEPFFTTKGVEGTGLGLATVYGIVKQHGGHISVYSEPGRGTTFKVYFPRYSGTAVPDENERVMDTLLYGRETLLVVEDQEQVRTITVSILKDCWKLSM